MKVNTPDDECIESSGTNIEGSSDEGSSVEGSTMPVFQTSKQQIAPTTINSNPKTSQSQPKLPLKSKVFTRKNTVQLCNQPVEIPPNTRDTTKNTREAGLRA